MREIFFSSCSAAEKVLKGAYYVDEKSIPALKIKAIWDMPNWILYLVSI